MQVQKFTPRRIVAQGVSLPESLTLTGVRGNNCGEQY